ncbi:unnamed protein product, partial [Prorocentrum cordatum]
AAAAGRDAAARDAALEEAVGSLGRLREQALEAASRLEEGTRRLAGAHAGAAGAARRSWLELAEQLSATMGPITDAAEGQKCGILEAASAASALVEQLRAHQAEVLEALEAAADRALGEARACAAAGRAEASRCAAVADSARSRAQEALDQVP